MTEHVTTEPAPTTVVTTTVWQGTHVRDTLDISVRTDGERSILSVEELVGIAVRRNPKRAHLLVSTVLAKHVPTHPGVALAAGELLGLLVSGELDGDVHNAGGHDEAALGRGGAGSRAAAGFGVRLAALMAELAESNQLADVTAAAHSKEQLTALRSEIRAATIPSPAVVTLGFAETATGLGQIVGDALQSYYLHSTRHEVAGATSFTGFEEEHSHATDHGLLPTDPQWLRTGGTVVLVDDELSTGTTAINTVTAIQALLPQRRWVIASLIDLRSAADQRRFDELAEALGTRISVVSLASGSIELPVDVLSRAAQLIEALPPAADSPDLAGAVRWIDCTDLSAVRSARFGTTAPIDTAVARAIGERLHEVIGAADALSGGRGVLVLGSEEFIALPMTIADELSLLAGATPVRFSTSTRSPIATLDRADYPIASAVHFRSHDVTTDGVGDRFAYNLTAAGSRFGTIVFIPEPGTDPAALDGPNGVVEALRRVSTNVIVVLLSASDPTDGTSAS
ncbi:phosphoribosyltransferase-like predicted ribonucleoside biosynthesis protein [Glaciihabitans tibetensis]|uniref:Phosphoribosyltransferase-like predicted ribonucleoside biosynthesis protein n=1 Tax=Glaciihabitans tibetensis TaxID=1266600 RepID=A0A2T0VAB8_9MICO|nr:phosphoribosyltransferase domain-containing protein [Glaciihabitans tibetensis]PRY67145.1 phosphoribosyltransferase-like predicted ribonucleoside biosynthesis protein [Glaciihabitans tibetensis]